MLKIAKAHPAYRDKWSAGSIAQGTHNSPLGDADCGVMVNRMYEEFRAFGPDVVWLPDAEARFVRLVLHDGPARAYGIAELEVKDAWFGASPKNPLMLIRIAPNRKTQ